MEKRTGKHNNKDGKHNNYSWKENTLDKLPWSTWVWRQSSCIWTEVCKSHLPGDYCNNTTTLTW